MSKISKVKDLNKRPCVNIIVKNKNFTALIDSGATISVLSKSIFEKLPKNAILSAEPYEGEIVSASNNEIKNEKLITLKFQIQNLNFIQKFLIINTNKNKQSLILGSDFLYKNEFVLDLRNSFLKLKGKILPILFNDNHQIGENLVQCAQDTILSPHSIINIPCERASKEVSNTKHFALAISVINIWG